MILYFLLALVTITIAGFVNNKTTTLTYGYSKQQVLNGLSLLSVFLILFAVSSLRLNVGNDYAKYVEYFHLIRCKLDTDTVVPTEPGFNLVCIIIYLLSGRQENYLCMFAVFAFFTILLFLKGIYDQADEFWISFMMFMTLGYYFQSFSTVRYYFALALAFFSIKYVIDKKWDKFILLMIFGAFFHKSLVLVIPFYYLAQRKWKKWQIAVGMLFASTLFIFKDFYLNLFLKFYPTYEETEYLNSGTSIISILRCLAILIISLVMYKKYISDDRRMQFLFYSNLGALIIYAGCSFLPAVSRAGYYLSITHILFVPALILKIENEKIRKLALGLLIVACLVYFLVFLKFEAPANGLRILPYETWLYHDMVDILSDVM